jgi:formylmethanofuran dehydrogenase subunit E-like metal-binding protein
LKKLSKLPGSELEMPPQEEGEDASYYSEASSEGNSHDDAIINTVDNTQGV